MRLLHVRALMVFGVLLLLYALSPVTGVVLLAAGFTYVLMRQRSERAIRTDSFVSLNLN